ncbi:MAG TPA: phosphoribosylformylglycinamidine synthase subunit PurS [Gemmatimonadaceae bacterium]|nr:phosphoribosylformylglycinamidine synthase subunit PurS [Gemmatimonadaceae bacterium]
MSRFRVAVHIVPRRGILDPQGKAVADALHTLGFAAVREVRVGRHVVIDVDAADRDEADRAARAMCERLLANPVTEDFEIASVAAQPASPGAPARSPDAANAAAGVR